MHKSKVTVLWLIKQSYSCMCKHSLSSWYSMLTIFWPILPVRWFIWLADICTEQSHYRDKSICNPVIPWSSMCLGDGSDTSHNIYLRTAFMAKVVVHACWGYYLRVATIEQSCVKLFVFNWWHFWVAKLWTIFMPTGGNLPDFH